MPPARGASIFALNGLGEPVSPADVRALGMGGATIALGEGRSLSALNPATARAGEDALLGVELSPGLLRSEGPEAVLSTEGFGLEKARVLFPIGGGGTLAFGLHTVASFDTPRIETVLDGGDSLIYRRSTQSTGSIAALGGGCAFDLGALTLGVRGDYLFGSAVEEWRVSFEGDTLFHDSSGRPVPIRDQLDMWRTSILGARLAAGVLVRSTRVDFGLFGSYSPWAEGAEHFEGIASGNEARTEHSYTLPLEAGVGLSWRPLRGLTLAADAELSTWSAFEVDGRTQPALADSRRLAAGLEWYLGRDDTFLGANLPLRLGVARAPLPWRVAGPGAEWRPIGASRFTLGTGSSFAHGKGWADLAFEYIVRDQAEIREREYRFHLSLGLMEHWIRKLPAR